MAMQIYNPFIYFSRGAGKSFNFFIDVNAVDGWNKEGK